MTFLKMDYVMQRAPESNFALWFGIETIDRRIMMLYFFGFHKMSFCAKRLIRL